MPGVIGARSFLAGFQMRKCEMRIRVRVAVAISVAALLLLMVQPAQAGTTGLSSITALLTGLGLMGAGAGTQYVSRRRGGSAI